MKYLLTGAAGFIGMHVAERLLARGDSVVGLDNLNSYYDVRLKEKRVERLARHPGFRFVRADLVASATIAEVFARERPARVIHLAAQAGVQHSLRDPGAHVDTNLRGFLSVLEGCRNLGVEHLVFASSSSVYGANTRMPFSVHQPTDHPLSVYAATKKASELMAHTYSHLFGLPCTGLRFFTVFGPWGRPDMALFLFTRAILAGQPIKVFNFGRNRRDFTYVGDVAEGVVRIADRIPVPNPAWSGDAPDPATGPGPYRIYNVGNSSPVEVIEFVRILEECLGRTAEKHLLPPQPGDVEATWAEVDDFEQATGFRPATSVREGLQRFVDWYREYYGTGDPSPEASGAG